MFKKLGRHLGKDCRNSEVLGRRSVGDVIKEIELSVMIHACSKERERRKKEGGVNGILSERDASTGEIKRDINGGKEQKR